MQSLILSKTTWLAKAKRRFDKCCTYSGRVDSASLEALNLLGSYGAVGKVKHNNPYGRYEFDFELRPLEDLRFM